MTMIKIENLTKKYGNLTAVKDLTLHINRGELFTFLGPNGAGKTTTIKVMTGLLRPTKGAVYINNFDVQKDYLKAKQVIGYIPDQPYVYEKLTGREFINFICDLYEIGKNHREEKMLYYFNLFDLTENIDVLVENYSHGMRQKLVFTAALIHNPEVIIIDEPMVGLDPQSARLVKNLLKNEAKNGKTVFLSTHTLSIAEELADRIGIIKEGQLIFDGTLTQLRSQTTAQGNLEDLFLKLTGDEKKEKKLNN